MGRSVSSDWKPSVELSVENLSEAEGKQLVVIRQSVEDTGSELTERESHRNDVDPNT